MQTSWQYKLDVSLQKNCDEPQSRFFQLATIGLKGSPSVRTVVFRGFDDSTNDLQIITDTRSEKVTEINTDNRVSLCWYFTETREQYRLYGHARVMDSAQPQVVKAWHQLSENGKSQFMWGQPKHLISAGEFGEDTVNTKHTVFDKIPCGNIPDSVCVLAIDINKVDYLNLMQPYAGRAQARQIYTKVNDKWTIENVVP